jgi:hypothetical protein
MGELPSKGAEASKGKIGPSQVTQHLGQEANWGVGKGGGWAVPFVPRLFNPSLQAPGLLCSLSQLAVQTTLAAKLQAFEPEADISEAPATQRAAGLSPNGLLTNAFERLHGQRLLAAMLRAFGD